MLTEAQAKKPTVKGEAEAKLNIPKALCPGVFRHAYVKLRKTKAKITSEGPAAKKMETAAAGGHGSSRG